MSEVSRETAAAESAAAVFSTQLPLAERYAELLATEGVRRGLIGPRESDRLWDRHILNCAVIAELIDPSADVLDIGSGAGLPGIPLAIVRPDLWITLVEPMERRTTFLEEAIERLELSNVEVVRSRAEEVRPRGKADVVTSRALAPLDKLAHWCLPLARRGGQVLAIKGASAADEIAKHERTIGKRGARRVSVVRCGTGLLETPTTVIRMYHSV
ncbi:MAG TPA: 16S rRNA (guanine(527)-N(7))-methyltransferase RsmG [Stackebrandtia sp.]|jgi:16S rRNA (guanine527-N7)-methyltransferase|uniref:16S rRNA (guanine(527)-N(7))-methyltransferase RsmG n=1 Tax=Stackebrandtia sp. TaxID=2023065 RepID=UPI002D2DDB33|nr:16S rRNA (guanine(527)-N(7))-methyltransferase RsmG [Stackebrandtia sp.]HZE39444.1 16S rRNA (guanine(527)-N(7))-methyltransferase RsmG [Stackebrandtia sp.]